MGLVLHRGLGLEDFLRQISGTGEWHQQKERCWRGINVLKLEPHYEQQSVYGAAFDKNGLKGVKLIDYGDSLFDGDRFSLKDPNSYYAGNFSDGNFFVFNFSKVTIHKPGSFSMGRISEGVVRALCEKPKPDSNPLRSVLSLAELAAGSEPLELYDKNSNGIVVRYTMGVGGDFNIEYILLGDKEPFRRTLVHPAGTKVCPQPHLYYFLETGGSKNEVRELLNVPHKRIDGTTYSLCSKTESGEVWALAIKREDGSCVGIEIPRMFPHAAISLGFASILDLYEIDFDRNEMYMSRNWESLELFERFVRFIPKEQERKKQGVAKI